VLRTECAWAQFFASHAGAYTVDLIIPSAGINTSSVPNRVFLDALDSIAEFKHSVAVESINAGMAAAQARGVKFGRPVTIDATPRGRGQIARARQDWSRYRKGAEHPEFERLQTNQGNKP
jgi:DNA invertase Pin-like site-specific DNA recombinase